MAKQITRAESVLISDNLKTTSLVIAKHFGKRHDDVLKRIRNLEVPATFNARNFAGVEYTDSKGELRPSYEITRDGFALLVMGFTGKRAMVWKIKFLEAFNKMESEVLGPRTAKGLVNQAAFMQGMQASFRRKSPEELAAWAHGSPTKVDQLISYIETTLIDPMLNAEAARELSRLRAIAKHLRGDTPEIKVTPVRAHVRRISEVK